jgi:diadenosine tetraphosphate (Ap4A) HIT family hydrolase
MSDAGPIAVCLSCELIARRDRGEAPDWDCILRTDYWDVVHSYDTSLPGWLVLIARRHVAAVDALTVDEMRACGVLQHQVSVALKQAVGCERTYVAQFTESPEHPHVHFHVIPRMPDMPDEARGPNVFQRYLGVGEAARVPETQMNAIAQSVGGSLLTPIGNETPNLS